jgi:hypothetical protein
LSQDIGTKLKPWRKGYIKQLVGIDPETNEEVPINTLDLLERAELADFEEALDDEQEAREQADGALQEAIDDLEEALGNIEVPTSQNLLFKREFIEGDDVETSWDLSMDTGVTILLVQTFSVATGKQVYLDPEISGNTVTLSTPEPLEDGYQVMVCILGVVLPSSGD